GRRLGCTDWGLEGAGCYGYAFSVFARADGATVLEVPGVLTKRHRRHSSRRGKSDETDAHAHAIAEVVLREADRLPGFHPSVLQRALRLRYDRRDRLVRERTRSVNRLRMAAVLLGVVELPRDLTSRKAARLVTDMASRFRDEVRLHAAASAIVDDLQDAAEDILRLTALIRAAERQLELLTTDISSELAAVHGISSVVAAGLIGHAGDLRNYRNAGAFAAKCGAAPVPCSSGRRVAVRVNRGGDRQLNRLLHIIAIAQVATKTHPGRQYYDRKRSEGKTHPSAMRCLKRQLATVVYYHLTAVQDRLVVADVAA
ncbi:MAG TPA: transposase, partial [Thermoleophilia bacterium]|nr:transposase [Thermoleophilia bacterium]